MKKWKKVLVLTLITIIVSGTFDLFAFAAGETEAQETDPYIYQYEGNQTQTSKHRFTFQWWYKNNARESIRNRYHATNIFEVVNTEKSGEISSAYCSDFLYGIVDQTKYKRINLEDSTYYNDAAAEHIRGIMEKGYWCTWTSEDLQKAENDANAWIASYQESDFVTEAFLPYDAEEAVSPISNLTADEALTATQLAIWAFANTEGDDWWVKYYESFPTEVEKEYNHAEFSNNIKAFRKYLIHQQSQQIAPEDIVFTDQYFVTDSIVFTGAANGAAEYNLTLKVKLAAPIDDRDDLTLTASLADREGVNFALNGENALTPGKDGYYALQFTGVTKEEAAAGVKLAITGSQYVDGIYFYEAKPGDADARETSQNLVGKATGMTPVSVDTALALDLGTKSISLYKYDGEKDTPLEGAVFDLYAENGDVDHLVMTNLISDGDGQISVSGLPEDYRYYFKEVAAPKGYFFEDGHNVHVVGEDGAVAVPNNPIPLTELTVEKKWVNEENKALPDAIKVQLLKNGEAEGNPISLTADNNWTYHWQGLDARDAWTVKEVEVPYGYTSETAVNADGTKVTITNTGIDLKVSLYKYGVASAGETRSPLAGAQFQLYRLVGEEYQLVSEDVYVTDADGHLLIDHLPEGYRDEQGFHAYAYYFKEVAPPEGYEIIDDGYIKADAVLMSEEESPVLVENLLVPPTDETPDDEQLPEEKPSEDPLPEEPSNQDDTPLPNDDETIPVDQNLPITEPESQTPTTGDNAPIELFILAAAISISSLVALKKRH